MKNPSLKIISCCAPNFYKALSPLNEMPHQCVHCKQVYPDASKELLEGCVCGSKFFFYVRKEQLQQLQEKIVELESLDKEEVEEDIREMIGALDEDYPVILDLESIRVVGPGKFEIDIINLLTKKRPLIYKLEEGKYVIDIASSMLQGLKKKEHE